MRRSTSLLETTAMERPMCDALHYLGLTRSTLDQPTIRTLPVNLALIKANIGRKGQIIAWI